MGVYRGVAAIFLALLAVACHPVGELAATAGPATAGPLVFHGNCVTGWLVALPLRLTETSGVEVNLDRFSYRISDDGAHRELAAETMDGASLESAAGGRVVPAHGEMRIPVTAFSQRRPVGPVLLAGEIAGRDGRGRSVIAAVEVHTSLTVAPDPVDSAGACTP